MSQFKLEKLKESLNFYYSEFQRLKERLSELSRPKAGRSREEGNKGLSDLKTWLQDQQSSKRSTNDFRVKVSDKDSSSSVRENKVVRLKPQSVEARQKEGGRSAVSTDELLFQLNFRKKVQNRRVLGK